MSFMRPFLAAAYSGTQTRHPPALALDKPGIQAVKEDFQELLLSVKQKA